MKRTPQNTTTGGATGVTTDMRVIVPLQGVVQGRGGLVLGSVIPCALFYFFQLYLKRKNRSSGDDAHAPPPPPPEISPPGPGGLQRVPSVRSMWSPRGLNGQPQVSSRANSVLKQRDSLYYAGLKRASEDPYDEFGNPDGIIQLGLDENKLSLDLVQDWLMENANHSIISQDSCMKGIATYQPFDGLWELKVAAAGFMSRVLEGRAVFDPSRMVLTAGTAAAIEMLVFCLADPGNAFLVPSPYCPDLDTDIKFRTGVEIIPVPCRSSDNFGLNTTALHRAYHHAKKRGLKVCGLIVSNPSNPTGSLLTRESIRKLLDFSAEKNIHVIANEVLAARKEFVSMAEVAGPAEGYDNDRVHIVYGLSKDVSAPGFRAAVVYTANRNVLIASKRLVRFSSLSGLTQRLLGTMLTDSGFVERFVRENRERLEWAHERFVDGLSGLGVGCTKTGGGFCCWADFSGFIRPYSEKGEIDLWERLLTLGKVNATAGSWCHCVEPGWFRFCFAALNEAEIPLVVARIKRAL